MPRNTDKLCVKRATIRPYPCCFTKQQREHEFTGVFVVESERACTDSISRVTGTVQGAITQEPDTM
jgi:hypothetical protein